MPLVILLIQLTLSLVFGLAGVTKLLDLAGTRQAIRNFGAPESTVPLLSLLLPFGEIAIAIALLFRSTAAYASVAALLLLALFVVVIGINIARGQAPECHCFGQLHSRPVGWPTLTRNIVFASAAVFLITRGADLVSMTDSPLAIGIFLSLVVLAGAAIFFRKKRPDKQTATALSPGLPVGATAPLFDLPHYEGGIGSLVQLLANGKQVLLVFTSPMCGPCVSLFREIGEWQRTHTDELTVAIVSRGTIKENFVNTVRNGLQNVLLQNEHEVADLYVASVTPAALIIRNDGTIGSSLAKGADEIRALLHSTLGKSNSVSDPDSAQQSDSVGGVADAYLQTE
jgi:peroxiredoxin